MASVRFICGTQDIHKELEAALTKFLGTEDTILYPSAFDANGGLFETMLAEKDAVISDELNHASIIDGIRLCKAQRFRYKHNDMADLEAKLQAAKERAFPTDRDRRLFLDGRNDRRSKINRRSRRKIRRAHDDRRRARDRFSRSERTRHARISRRHGRIDIITGTLGKALGGASGGFTSGRKEIVDLLRQRSRPYLFSNTVAPPIVAATLESAGVADCVDRAARQAGREHEIFPRPL